MVSESISPAWLEQLWWREAWLTLEATAPATLPPYLGSTLRGALGHLLRAALCEGSGCGHECQRPETCRYYALFEREREGAKPFLLLPPAPPGLEEIALGGPVSLPYRSGPAHSGEGIPTLRCEGEWRFDAGATLCFGLRLMGSVAQALPAIVEAVARFGLNLGGTPFRLAFARDDLGHLLYDRRFPDVPAQAPGLRRFLPEAVPARRIRLVFLTPAVFKLDKTCTFRPDDFAARFFEHSLGRAVQMHRTCCSTRLPWIEAPAVRAEMTAHRLFHYELPRHSFRQEKWLDFDGVVGWLDLVGDVTEAMVWGRAAEILHFGQKAAFGLGRVRVLVLE